MVRRAILFSAILLSCGAGNSFAADDDIHMPSYYTAPDGNYIELKSTRWTRLASNATASVGIGRDLDDDPAASNEKLIVSNGVAVVEDTGPFSGQVELRDSGSAHYWQMTMDGPPSETFSIFFDDNAGTVNRFLTVSSTTDPATGTRNIGFWTDAPAYPLDCTAFNGAHVTSYMGSTGGGQWIDGPCVKSEKEELKALEISGYIDKLKNLQMYSFKKKAEVYGRKIKSIKDGREVLSYPDKAINPNARTYIGYCLDDSTTPDEIIARDRAGEISGISPQQNANFLMAVLKELTAKVERLEAEYAELQKSRRG